MAFRFKRKESISESIQRISRQCVVKALKSCKEDESASIHAARKEIKKLRALLRLVKNDIGGRSFQRRMEPLREAAGCLAPARDAHVQAAAFEHLLQPRRRAARPAPLDNIAKALKKECQAQVLRFRQEDRAQAVRGILKKQPSNFKKLEFQHHGWGVIGSGLEKSYRAARDARDQAEAEPTADNFHEWRKRVKDLWYNIQLLHPIWPEQMCAAAAELEKLGELLGDDHDLHLLAQSAVKKSVNVDLETEAHQLLKIIDARKRDLQTEALQSGHHFFQEKPSDFCRRLHGYWKLWKAKKKQRKRQNKQASTGARAQSRIHALA
jgi:CHAD domain-containing protein